MNNLIILQDTTIPEAAPKQLGTNGLPGSFDQSDIEIEITASPDKKCDPIECQVSVVLRPRPIHYSRKSDHLFVHVVKVLCCGNSSNNPAFACSLRR